MKPVSATHPQTHDHTSASEMTDIVSGGALNFTHSPRPILRIEKHNSTSSCRKKATVRRKLWLIVNTNFRDYSDGW